MQRIALLSLCLLLAGPATGQTITERTILLELSGLTHDQLRDTLDAHDAYARDQIISFVRDTALVIATAEEARMLSNSAPHARVLMEDNDAVRLYRRALYGESLEISPVYHSYERILAKADSLIARHPNLISRMHIGRTTQSGRSIYAFRVSNEASRLQDKPGILFNGVHHADELMGAQITTALLEELLDGYGTDPRVTEWVDTYEIYIVPVVNVDGHHVVTSSVDPRWRKNTRVFNADGALYRYPEGVDPNRNYDFNWALGGSGDPLNIRYRGSYPFSEAENRAMRSLLEKKKFILSATYHSQGEVIYYPWTWRGRPAPDDDLIANIAQEMAARIPTMSGDSSYRAEPGAATVGQSYSWMYGRHGTIDLIVEVGLGVRVFPPREVRGLVDANLNGARYLLERGMGPGLTGHVTDATTGEPIEAVVWFPTIESEEVDRRTTDAVFGRYFRLVNPGSYDVIFKKEGYRTAVFPQVQVGPTGWTELSVTLEPETE
jgi:carboxypeptidase T